LRRNKEKDFNSRKICPAGRDFWQIFLDPEARMAEGSNIDNRNIISYMYVKKR